MTKIFETIRQIKRRIWGCEFVAHLSTDAELVVRGRLERSAVVITTDGRQYALGEYIIQFIEEQS